MPEFIYQVVCTRCRRGIPNQAREIHDPEYGTMYRAVPDGVRIEKWPGIYHTYHYECAASLAAIDAYLGELTGDARETLRQAIDTGLYCGPTAYLESLVAHTQPDRSIVDDASEWTMTFVRAAGVTPQVVIPDGATTVVTIGGTP